MDIVLYPRAAPGDRLRVWIGIFHTTAAPALNWLLNGISVVPVALRQLSSARPAAMLPAGTQPDQAARAFTGIYEFTGLTPDTCYAITAEAGPGRATLNTRTLPAAVPTGFDRWFNVLLVSCFHQAEDRKGLAGTIASQLKAVTKPHLTLLMGDQVYLDLPTLQDFPDDLVWLAEKFENDYTRNWRGPLGYSQLLSTAPTLAVPDDHEYWNNYPHPSPFIGTSLTPAGRDRWQRAAQVLYEGFQLAYPNALGEPVQLEVEPLSFFVADTRSKRAEDRSCILPAEAHQQMDDWVSTVIAKQQFGVFVAGQSLFTQSIGHLAGAVVDYALPNYDDYGRLIRCLQRLADAGRPTLCLTGDVHWGRVVAAMDIRTGRTAFTEIISSPTSLVTTIGRDQVKQVGDFIGGLFGARNPWPRHASPEEPPAFLATDVLQGRFQCSTVHPQKGNHLALLRFRQHGSGLELRVTYWPITREASAASPIDLRPMYLVRAEENRP
jgi:phosphodiesterase/alkaline phosphatase D-like protein